MSPGLVALEVAALRAELPTAIVERLHADGFAVLPPQLSASEVATLAAAHDAAVAAADPRDCGSGRGCTRVWDFVNRGAAFDELYLLKPVLAACCHVIDAPFKLSTMHSRAINPRSEAQALHVDFAREQQDVERGAWPMLGFILMIDDFRLDNGATRFVSGSHSRGDPPAGAATVAACGPAGSLIVYNGAVWHGYGANATEQPRRSIRGAYIRRDAQGFPLAARMLPETLGRMTPIARYLVAV
jgi:ectoine hydroxylase-related dioxygenase (phytanoyl-CoA dioxygenase family)